MQPLSHSRHQEFSNKDSSGEKKSQKFRLRPPRPYDKQRFKEDLRISSYDSIMSGIRTPLVNEQETHRGRFNQLNASQGISFRSQSNATPKY